MCPVWNMDLGEKTNKQKNEFGWDLNTKYFKT